MKIATSYFYQIRNFKPWMIPVSTAISDPFWYQCADGEYYIDKRGVVNGLRYEPLIVQGQLHCECPCARKDELKGDCSFAKNYELLLEFAVDKERTLKAFNFCADKFTRELNLKEEPIIVLMVYEACSNPCSERYALQKFFNCKELEYPII